METKTEKHVRFCIFVGQRHDHHEILAFFLKMDNGYCDIEEPLRVVQTTT